MRAVLRQLHSPDIDDLPSWSPGGEDFAVLIQMLVGPADGPGEESFDVVLTTAGPLVARSDAEGVIDLRHHLLVTEFNYDAVFVYLAKRVSQCEGATWGEVASLVGRLGRWEFEDYVPRA